MIDSSLQTADSRVFITCSRIVQVSAAAEKRFLLLDLGNVLHCIIISHFLKDLRIALLCRSPFHPSPDYALETFFLWPLGLFQQA
jgi:hypothetical protein